MKKFIIAFVCALAVLPVYAQDANRITGILAKKAATISDFSYLVASELGMEASPFEAYAYCDRFNTFRFTDTANTPVTVRMASRFFMENYGINGGLMWSISHAERYAWKELKAKGFWKKGLDPDNVLSGRDLVVSINKFFSMYPDARLRNPPSIEASDELRAALLGAREEIQ
jgi:hypothetical protein